MDVKDITEVEVWARNRKIVFTRACWDAHWIHSNSWNKGKRTGGWASTHAGYLKDLEKSARFKGHAVMWCDLGEESAPGQCFSAFALCPLPSHFAATHAPTRYRSLSVMAVRE